MEAPVREPERPETVLSTDVAELHLLIGEMDDELTAYRRREAAWASIVVHVLVFLALIFIPKWLPKSAVVIPVTQTTKDTSFLLAPPDPHHVKVPPKTDITSDKNRIAQSPRPVLNPKLLRKLLDAGRPGPPANKPAAPPAPTQQAAQQPLPEPNPQQRVGAQNAPPESPQQTAQLHTPPAGGPSPFKTTGPGIQHALDSLGASHGVSHYTFGGDYGSNLQPNTNMRGDVEILSDTMGVDFGPYLQRVLFRIKGNWYNLIPEVARPPIMKKGWLIIQFSILKDGRVAGMLLTLPSGDVSLDHAAWGGITESDPFGRLPTEFAGPYLTLRIKFIYNSSLDEVN
jgi:outer membrane biosynthesis protein TonB